MTILFWDKSHTFSSLETCTVDLDETGFGLTINVRKVMQNFLGLSNKARFFCKYVVRINAIVRLMWPGWGQLSTNSIGWDPIRHECNGQMKWTAWLLFHVLIPVYYCIYIDKMQLDLGVGSFTLTSVELGLSSQSRYLCEPPSHWDGKATYNTSWQRRKFFSNSKMQIMHSCAS